MSNSSQRKPSASYSAAPRGGRVGIGWLMLGWLIFVGWLTLVGLNAAPYLNGRPMPLASDLLGRLVALPVALPLPATLTAPVTWAISALALFIGVVTAAVTFSPAVRTVETQAPVADPTTGPAATGVLAGLPATQGAWQADPMHTQVEFSVQHLGMMRVRGNFAEVSVSGTIDPPHPERTALAVTIQAVSIRTDNENRDNDLRASNFLDAATYPTIMFKSTTIEHVVGNRYTMAGDLTIRGVTRPVTLTVVVLGEFNDPNMGHRIGYTCEGVINRKDFGMTFNMLLDGKWMVGDEVQLLIQGEIIEQKPEQATGS